MELGVFLLPGELAIVLTFPPFFPEALGDGGIILPLLCEICCDPGFIWMILRDLVGGGGKENSAVVVFDGGC